MDPKELTINDIPDEYLEVIARETSMAVPWQYSPDDNTYRDPDMGDAAIPSTQKDDTSLSREIIQAQCFMKATRNPQVSTAIRGVTGRLTGFSFGCSSEVPEIQTVLEEIELDPRNRLYNYWPKYASRGKIEGELFLCFTCHSDGFIEVDFIDPAAVTSGQVDSGIIFHSRKTNTPLIYCISDEKGNSEQIPSIFIARYPEWIEDAKNQKGYSASLLKGSRSRKKIFKSMGGFFRFIVAWDQGLVTKRNIGHVRTVLEWVEHWENLKKYELDHKKSAGAYLWVIQFTDVRSWIQWLKMSDADRAKTGIAAKKTPGGTLVLGPNMEMKALNPTLPNISNSDTDIMSMVTSGLNEPKDVTTGEADGTFASVNASRGPMSDRVSDEIAYFERFLKYDFWANIFFLKSKIAGFPKFFKSKEAVGFKNGEVIFKTVNRKPEELLDISFPTSEINDMESRARALFGVKHADLSDTAGLPKSELVKKLGYGNYARLRLKYETEKQKYPTLPITLDAESLQESQQTERARNANPQTE
ncbi:MAG: hypothetical protein JRJ29_17645 [Deltaproteobacteria bacterium]|nr:hypothetical protein [Deltaproteobacteria bacterium]